MSCLLIDDCPSLLANGWSYNTPCQSLTLAWARWRIGFVYWHRPCLCSQSRCFSETSFLFIYTCVQHESPAALVISKHNRLQSRQTPGSPMQWVQSGLSNERDTRETGKGMNGFFKKEKACGIFLSGLFKSFFLFFFPWEFPTVMEVCRSAIFYLLPYGSNHVRRLQHLRCLPRHTCPHFLSWPEVNQRHGNRWQDSVSWLLNLPPLDLPS